MKKWCYLFIGYRGGLALGRVGFWLAFCIAIYFWLARPVDAFPKTLETTLGYFLAYNFGSKTVGQLINLKKLNYMENQESE